MTNKRMTKKEKLEYALYMREFYAKWEQIFEKSKNKYMHERMLKHLVKESDKIYDLCWGFDKAVYEAGAVL